jgi:sugar lactone lactonase YvrE
VLALALVPGSALAGSSPALAAAHAAHHPAAQSPEAGDISTIAGSPGGPGLATHVGLLDPSSVATNGNYLYIANDYSAQKVAETTDRLATVAGNGTPYSPLGDGGLATAAGLTQATGAAVTGDGSLLLSDVRSNRIRMVAAKTGTFFKQAMTAGHIYTVAGDGENSRTVNGSLATSTALALPADVAVDRTGNLVIPTGLNEIQVVAAKPGTYYGRTMAAGHIYLVAGGEQPGYSGDGGPATKAQLNYPGGVGVDGAGNLLIADQGNYRIRVVAASTSTFYGKAMTAGDIYTIAGDGTRGYSGDGGPATSAELNQPNGVAVDGAGDVFIADSGNFRIREISAG